MRKFVLGLVALTLAGCVTTTTNPATNPPPQASAPTAPPPEVSQNRAARNFLTVVQQMEPIAERECRARTTGNCDFKIVVDDRADQASNAYQTLDKSGRPVIAFTTALLADARNQHELAFILGHEVAHHIRGHIPKSQQRAVAGAVVGGLLAAVLGAGDATIQEAQRMGSAVGARSYSKDFELEADQLGTIITARAGYDPVKGAAYFSRIPDPGDRFLGSHPPNSQRIAIVRNTVANM